MEQFLQISGVGVAALTITLTYRLLANHINHLTNSIEKLSSAVESLKEIIIKELGEDKE